MPLGEAVRDAVAVIEEVGVLELVRLAVIEDVRVALLVRVCVGERVALTVDDAVIDALDELVALMLAV